MNKFRVGISCIDDDEWSWCIEGHNGERWIILGDGCAYSKPEAAAEVRGLMAKHGATVVNTTMMPF